MDYDINFDDHVVLTIMKAALVKFRDSANELSDEYPPTSPEGIATGEIGSRINPVLVALEEVLGSD
jgi:hypothetical protein